MADKPKRVLVPLDSYDETTLRVALAHAAQIAKDTGAAVKEFILLTHTQSQLSGTSLGAALGSANLATLKARKSLSLGQGVTLRAETLKTLPFGPRDSVIIAYYADDKMMVAVDGLSHLAGVVVVPDYSDSVPQWTERWTPLVHGQAAQPPAVLISDPKVEGAMKELTGAINLGHGLLNPRDKETASDVLRILRAKGHSTDTTKLKSWAIREGWKPGAAAELATLAAKIFALKAKPKLDKIHDPDGRYARW